jgi:hypothetical protein
MIATSVSRLRRNFVGALTVLSLVLGLAVASYASVHGLSYIRLGGIGWGNGETHGLLGLSVTAHHGYVPFLLYRAHPLTFMVVVATLSILPARWLALRVRQRRRIESGRCTTCGYDVRATPDRCPECGAVSSAEGPSELADWEFRGLEAAMLIQCFVSAAAVGLCSWLGHIHPLPLAMHLAVGAFGVLSCGWVWLKNRSGEWPGHPQHHGKEVATPRRAVVLSAWQVGVTGLWWFVYCVHVSQVMLS